MEKKKLLQAIMIGIIIFACTQIFFRSYTYLMIKLLDGATRTPFTLFLNATWTMAKWICVPFSTVFWRIIYQTFKHNINFVQHVPFYVALLNFFGWVGLSLLVSYLKNKHNPAPK